MTHATNAAAATPLHIYIRHFHAISLFSTPTSPLRCSSCIIDSRLPRRYVIQHIVIFIITPPKAITACIFLPIRPRFFTAFFFSSLHADRAPFRLDAFRRFHFQHYLSFHAYTCFISDRRDGKRFVAARFSGEYGFIFAIEIDAFADINISKFCITPLPPLYLLRFRCCFSWD